MWCDTFTNCNRNRYGNCDTHSNSESDSTVFPKPNGRRHRDTLFDASRKRDADAGSCGAGHQPLDSDASSDRQ